jgi:hypothetical protein
MVYGEVINVSTCFTCMVESFRTLMNQALNAYFSAETEVFISEY